jgi:hypothetical protein
MDEPSDEVLAEALQAFFPADYDPDDITTWTATQLGVWNATLLGLELTDAPLDMVEDHAITPADAFTTEGEA